MSELQIGVGELEEIGESICPYCDTVFSSGKWFVSIFNGTNAYYYGELHTCCDCSIEHIIYLNTEELAHNIREHIVRTVVRTKTIYNFSLIPLSPEIVEDLH